MKDEPYIAIVLLNHNGKNYLEQNLPFLKKVTYKNKKIYVIDNNSQDDSKEYLQIHHPDIEIIHNDRNLGYAAGYNVGLARIPGEYFCLLNTDVKVTEGFLEPIIFMMEDDNNIGVAQPKILSLSKNRQFEYAGGAGGWIDTFGYTFARGRIFDTLEQDRGQYDDRCSIFWASGACFIIRSALFKKLDGFYEYYFMYCEEVDLCWRTIAEGYKVAYCSQAVIYHRDTDNLLHKSPERLFYLFRNSLIMLHRNLPSASAIWVIPARLILNITSILFFFVKGHFRISFAATKAHIFYLKWVLFHPTTATATKKISMNKIKPMYHGSIVYNYYIRGKKKFRDIVTLNLDGSQKK